MLAQKDHACRRLKSCVKIIHYTMRCAMEKHRASHPTIAHRILPSHHQFSRLRGGHPRRQAQHVCTRQTISDLGLPEKNTHSEPVNWNTVTRPTFYSSLEASLSYRHCTKKSCLIVTVEQLKSMHIQNIR